MFERLGSLTYRLRFGVVGAWVAAALAAALFAPSLASHGQSDQTGFLPATSVSVQARDTLERTFPGQMATSSATLTFRRSDGLTDADRAYVAAVATWITGPDATPALRDTVASVDTAASRPELASILRSDDGRLELATVNLSVPTAGDASGAAVAALREHLASTTPNGLATHVTGTAAISADYLDAVIRGTDSTTAVTVVLVIAILLLIYRAPLAAFVPLATIGAAFLVARGVLGVLAAAGWQVSSLLDTFIVVLVFGVGTDYTIFLISRFREEVAGRSWHDASRVTVRRIGEVITASAATVIVGLGSMAFAEFGMIQTTGPALAVAIAVTLVAGLTLAPALLGIFGSYLFWPLHARLDTGDEAGGAFAHLAAAVSHHPGVVTVVVLAALLIPATAVGGMRTNFDVLSELPAESDARAGFDDVAADMGRGTIVQSTAIVASGDGQDLLAPASLARLRDLAQTLVATPGVSTVTTIVSPDGDGVVPDGLRPSTQLASMADGFAGSGGPQDAPASSAALLDPDLTEGLGTATDYLAGLAVVFPDIAAGSSYRAAHADLAAAVEEVARVRDSSMVSSQLRTLSAALRSPASLVAGSGEAGEGTRSSLVTDYLNELAAAYPDVRSDPAFEHAVTDAAAIARTRDLAAALDLASRLDGLATGFDDRPGATLFPESLAATPESQAMRREVQATFDRLPADLDALAHVFAGRADDLYVPVGLGGDEGADVTRAVDAFLAADHTAARLYLTTSDDPYSPAAFRTIRAVQQRLADAAPGFGAGATALLGGPTAEFADVQDVLASDFQRVGVITVAGILAVLMVLLRAVVAPIYLVATVLLSCATAIGLSAWLFQGPLGQPGVSFYLPLLVFVLLVALGSDYNIFLMSRVREESARRPIRDGIRVASGRTGAVITSAGLILAGTFGSMATAPLAVLFQVGVAVALGVLIDTLIVRSILVPAITTLVGDRAWWPTGSGLAAVLRGWPAGASAPLALGAAAPDLEPGHAAPEPSARRRPAVLALVALVPVAFALLFTWSLSGQAGSLRGLTAAVVDLDTGSMFTAPDGSTRPLRLGDQLVADLTRGDATDELTWQAADPAEARDGLAAGRYDLVLTVPGDFSASIAAIRGDATGQAPRATLTLETVGATHPAAANAAASISRAIADTTRVGIVSSYVDDVLVRVDGAHDDLATAATRATTVAAGSTDLEAGASDVSSLAGSLVSGLQELAAGASDAGDGSRAMADGLTSLAGGARQLADGTTELAGGLRTARNGAAQVAGGAGALSDGLDALSTSAAGLPGQAGALADGASAVSDGVEGIAAGARTLAESLAEVRAGTAGLGDEAAALDAGATGLVGGSHDLAGGLALARQAADDLHAGTTQLAGSVDTYTAQVQELAASCATLGGSAALCAQLGAIATAGADLDSAADAARAGAARLEGSFTDLVAGADELVDGARTLAGGTGDLAASAPLLERGVVGSANGADDLAARAADLATGAHRTASGAAELSGGLAALVGGIGDAASGAGAVSDGAHGVADGLSTAAGAARTLTSGARAVARGAEELATGATGAASGAATLTDALGQALDGARLVEAGSEAVVTDQQALSGKAAALATELQSSSGAVPGYEPSARDNVAQRIADPVGVSVTPAGTAGGEDLAPYFMALGLLIGALAAALILPAIGRPGWPAGRSRRLVVTIVGASAVAGVQGSLVVIAMPLVAGTDAVSPAALGGVALLAALTFAALTQALVALFGRRGWFLALLLVALQLTSAGWPYPIDAAPWPLRLVHPLLPMTYAVDGLRAAATGVGSIGIPAVFLAGWLLAATLVVLGVAARPGRAAEGPAPRTPSPA